MKVHAKLPLGPDSDQIKRFPRLGADEKFAFIRQWLIRLLQVPTLIATFEAKGWAVEFWDHELRLYPPGPMSRKALRAMISRLEANDYQLTKQPYSSERFIPFDPNDWVGTPACNGEDAPRPTERSPDATAPIGDLNNEKPKNAVLQDHCTSRWLGPAGQPGSQTRTGICPNITFFWSLGSNQARPDS